MLILIVIVVFINICKTKNSWILLLSSFTKLNVSERCDALSNKIGIVGIIGKVFAKL